LGVWGFGSGCGRRLISSVKAAICHFLKQPRSHFISSRRLPKARYWQDTGKILARILDIIS
jgi:hypothetical protein